MSWANVILEPITSARLLREGESLAHLPVDLPHPDPEWTWVAEVDGKAAAAVLMAPCHGSVLFVRIASSPDGKYLLSRLLRRVFRDCRERGYTGYLMYADPSLPVEAKLLRLLEKSGTLVRYPRPQVLVGGALGDLLKW